MKTIMNAMINKLLLSLSLVLSITLSACATETNNTNNSTSSSAFPSKPGIIFHEGNWAAAKAKAKKENKLIFFDAHAAWCRPCKILKKRTFTDPTVKEYFDKNFINVEMDMEKGEGIALSEKLGLRVYPTLYFITPAGKVVAKKEGLISPETLLDWAKTTSKANPQN